MMVRNFHNIISLRVRRDQQPEVSFNDMDPLDDMGLFTDSEIGVDQRFTWFPYIKTSHPERIESIHIEDTYY